MYTHGPLQAQPPFPGPTAKYVFLVIVGSRVRVLLPLGNITASCIHDAMHVSFGNVCWSLRRIANVAHQKMTINGHHLTCTTCDFKQWCFTDPPCPCLKQADCIFPLRLAPRTLRKKDRDNL